MQELRKVSKQERRSRERQRKRNDILDAAEYVFRSKGFLMAKTDEISDISGFSIGTIYNLFSSKQDLFEKMLIRMGERLLKNFQAQVIATNSESQGLEPLIRFRVTHYMQYLPLFQLFSVDWPEETTPLPLNKDSRATRLYHEYIAMAGKWIAQQTGCPEQKRVRLALALEGTLHTFIGFWSRPQDAKSIDRMIQAIIGTFSNEMEGLETSLPTLPLLPETASPRMREIHISRIDRGRLKELLVVAKTFTEGQPPHYLSELEEELNRASLVEPTDIPPDLVTMNTRVQLIEPASGKKWLCTLVYPANLGSSPENVSILDPVGARLLGRCIGDTFNVPGSTTEKVYQVAAIDYQPEAAGEYYL